MTELVVQLIPLVIGIVMSPLAIMALVAILVSKLARANGIAFLIGWAIGVVGVVLLGLWLFSVLGVHELQDPPVWTYVMRLVFGVLLVIGAVWVYRRGHAHVKAMAEADTPQEVVAAAPQLPGWLQTVSTFRPARSLAPGVGGFVLSPGAASGAVVAALDVTIAGLDSGPTTAIVAGFCVIGVLPIAVPVIYVLLRGAKAQPFLDGLRTWVASHTNVLNAALLLVIGAMQLQKALSGFFS